MQRPIPLQPDRNDSGPYGSLKEFGKDVLRVGQSWRIDEIAKRAADQILERHSEMLRQSQIGDTYHPFQSQGKKRLVEAVDQLAITMLRADDGFGELVNLGL